MDIRYSANPSDVRYYTTEELRDEFLIQDLYLPDEVNTVYAHADRMVIIGVMPVSEQVPIDKDLDVWRSFGTHSFFERREGGFFNLGGGGVCIVDGKAYKMGYKDCLYIAKGVKEVLFSSEDAENPALFYGASTPAHCSYETRALSIADAAKKHVGSLETSNKRVINQFIHPDVLPTCQLLMGLTELEPCNVWNTMPTHTHERRTEVYTYFEMPKGSVVFHFMGEPYETRNIVVKNLEAVISPSWSIHSGCGVSSYSFIWAMGGENQAFDDMDAIPITEIE